MALGGWNSFAGTVLIERAAWPFVVGFDLLVLFQLSMLRGPLWLDLSNLACCFATFVRGLL